jgi:hypothetical protein
MIQRRESEATMATLQKTQDSTSRTKTGKAPGPKPVAAEKAPTSEMIAARAYEIWQESGCPEGCEQEHWHQAEAELLARAGK